MLKAECRKQNDERMTNVESQMPKKCRKPNDETFVLQASFVI